MTSPHTNALRQLKAGLAIAVVAGLCSHAVAQVAISDGGTPSYAYPISAPPGIAGMAPNLALTYSGAGINGPLGYGWSIQGMSVITRCPQTKAIDGYPRGVVFDVNDKLCLDGQRLIQTDANGTPVVAGDSSKPYGASNLFQVGDSQGGSAMVREYRTEKDSYARIRAYGSSGNSATNGPAYFKVWTKSGQIYEYGTNSNATANAAIVVQGQTVISAWAVSRIADTVGNYMDFQYTQRDTAWGTGTAANTYTPGHEWNLQEIRYTGNTASGQSPANRIAFTYTDRAASAPSGLSDRSEAYQRGSKNVSIQRLSAIRTYTNIQATQIEVKLVNLSYTNGAVTGRSLLSSISECSGANESACLPGPTFQYTNGGDQSFVKSAAFAASATSTSTKMLDATANKYGVVVGDFNGDGKADILRWGDTTTDNQLLLSKGDGNFNAVTPGTGPAQFNLTTQKLFSADGCYTSTVADFNGDGLADILRTTQTTSSSGGSCPTPSNILFLSNGDGSFQPGLALNGIDLAVLGQTYSSTATSCIYSSIDLHDGDHLAMADPVNGPYAAAQANTTCYNRAKTLGKAFQILDVNGDGILDIITTIWPAYKVTYQSGDPIPTADQSCASTVCTHVYQGSASGAFTEQTTNLTHHSVYSDPIKPGTYGAFIRPATVDVDGDGLTDLAVSTGVWLSTGDNNFTQTSPAYGVSCGFPLDFNGDGRFDCFTPSIDGTASGQTLKVMTGSATGNSLPSVAGFNLTTNGTNELYVANAGLQSIGTLFGDFNGDGRTDILRWENDPTKNVMYLSNGDGTFSTSSTFKLNGTAQGLQNSDGKTAYVAGDFRGLGVIEILRTKDSPSATSEATGNQLYVRNDPTPPDLLLTAVSASGLKTTLTWVPLTSSTPASPDDVYGPRYKSDRFDNTHPLQPGQVNLSIPLYVVAKTVSDSGVGGATVATQYNYAGLRAANDGRGLLGFRETKRQSPAPDGSGNFLTVDTQFLQTYPYTGVASTTSSYQGSLTTAVPTAPLSNTTYAYCDQSVTSITPTPTAPCAVTAKVQRPLLYQSVASGSDLNAAAFPIVTTTNTFDAFGNATNITVTTTGTVLGTQQTVAKVTANTYSNDTSGDYWVLGRLANASQHNTVPNFLSNIPGTAGSAANASANQGTGTLPPAPPPPPISPAVLSAILQMLLDD